LLPYGVTGHFSSKPKNCPVGLIATIATIATIKFCDGGGLLPDEILQVLDQAHLLILYNSIHLGLLSHIPEP
jgi:hypothetical protein